MPVASFVAISSILGTKLAVRFGTKLVVASGLFSMAAFYLWVTTTTVSTAYGTIAAQMVVLGTGMGLTSAPATEAIMGVVPKAKAGVGSAINDATRLLGGTLGVAVIGSVFASLYASRLTRALPAGLPATVARAAHASVGAAFTVAGRVAHAGHPALATALHSAAGSAFFDGFHAADYVAAGVAAAGAIMALALLPAQPTVSSGDTFEQRAPGSPARPRRAPDVHANRRQDTMTNRKPAQHRHGTRAQPRLRGRRRSTRRRRLPQPEPVRDHVSSIRAWIRRTSSASASVMRWSSVTSAGG